jgi:hypothetical protein
VLRRSGGTDDGTDDCERDEEKDADATDTAHARPGEWVALA